MVLKLSSFLATVLLFLGLFASPMLCARAPVAFLPSHHHHAHYHPHQVHRSKTDTDATNIQMVTGRQIKISGEPNPAPGHMAMSDKMAADDSSIADIGVPKQEADSMNLMNTPKLLADELVPRPTISGYTSGPHLESKRIMTRRTLLDTSSHSDPALRGEEAVNFVLASFTMQKDDNLFNMLPRAHRVPPSGPSRDHNSVLTDKSN